LRRRTRALAARAKAVRLVLLDVDGVLTDGTVLVHGDGSESKGFHIKDGAAMVWAMAAGLQIGWLSSRPSAATAHRASELGVTLLVQSARPKIKSYEEILRKHHLTDEQIAFMGDDLVDLGVLRRAGISAAPADAAADVRKRVDLVTRAAGGRGAVRELVEWVLRIQGRWEPLVSGWLNQGSQ
jgi:3-deoxy-D-manno-octulosonate 8-phosphate phosphatase (KDO 8-P phosphatase)